MSNLVDRLRKYGKRTEAHEAADRIEQLEELLSQFVVCCDTASPASLMFEISAVCKDARAALAPEQDK